MNDELPLGWAQTSLGEISRFERGVAFPTSEKSTDPRPGYIACLRTKNVQGEIDWSDLWFVPAQYAKTPAKQVQQDDILISTANSFNLVGKVARVRSVPVPSTFGAFIGVLRASGIDASFLHYRLGSPDFQSELRGAASQTTNIANISSSKMLDLRLNVPPLNEQRRIVDKLDAIFARTRAARARLESIPAMLDELRQSILAAAFRGDLTKEWRAKNPDVEPASVLLRDVRSTRDSRTLADALLGPSSPVELAVPTTWIVAPTGDIGHVQVGRRRAPEYQQGASRPYLRVANIKENRIDLADLNEMLFDDKEFEVYELKRGDILLSEGQSLELVGQSALFSAGPPGLCYQATLNRFRASAAVLPEYAQLYFRYCLRAGIFSSAAAITTNIAHLTQDKLRRVPFALAPMAEQREIVRLCSAAFASLEAAATRIESERAAVEQLEAAALAKAFCGELIPQDPNDEPASVLLERIRAERAAEPPTKRRRTSPPNPLSLKGEGESSSTNGQHAASSIERRRREAPQARSATEGVPIELLESALAQHGALTSADAQALTGLDASGVRPLLEKLVELGLAKKTGQARGTKYVWRG